MTDLQHAIQQLYEAFACYPKPAKIVSCPCGCTKPEETAPLLAVPLRQLPARDLRNYAFSAMTTQGTVEDFRYFLPRLFEAIVEDLDGISPEVLFGKLSYRKTMWARWPEPEAAAIKGYLHALWKRALSQYPIEEGLPQFFEIETVLACIALTGESLEPYLEVWSGTRTTAASECLVQLVTFQGSGFADGRTLSDGFWTDCAPQGEELRRWVLRLDTLQRVFDSAHLLRNDGFEHLFEPALDVLKKECLRFQ